MSRFLVASLIFFAGGCGGSSSPPAAAVVVKPHAAPSDQSRWMPVSGRLAVEMFADHMNGKAYLPGGTTGHYKTYDLWLVQAGTPTGAAVMLLDYKKDLAGAKLVPSFGGYFGEDSGGKPVFVFTKGSWLAGVNGLPQAEADAVARPFAALIR